MKAKLIADSNVLKPNHGHQNFIKTSEILKAGTPVEGELLLINGKRRGEDFTYRLFRCNDGKLIFHKNIEPMKTEVHLGANGQESGRATKIKMPSKFIENAHLIGAVGGCLAGVIAATKMKKPMKQKVMFGIGGAIVGYVAGRLIAGKPIISVSAPAVTEQKA